MMKPNAVFVDALGHSHLPVDGPARIACLVPSITELLFALDLGDQLVARTAYCVHPAGPLAAIPSVGGTKKIKHRQLRILAPTHVILNIDENTREMAAHLAEYVPGRIVTHPLAPADNIALYRLLGGIFRRQAQAEQLVQRFVAAQARLQTVQAELPSRRVLYLIWKKPWMAVSPDTYISRTLATAGLQTWPADHEPRYPVIDPVRIPADLDLILFSTEPYAFGAADLEEFARLSGYPPQRLRMIDGEMTSWYGPRAIQGLDYLRRSVQGLGQSSIEV